LKHLGTIALYEKYFNMTLLQPPYTATQNIIDDDDDDDGSNIANKTRIEPGSLFLFCTSSTPTHHTDYRHWAIFLGNSSLFVPSIFRLYSLIYYSNYCLSY
jgi:hypothetical protein